MYRHFRQVLPVLKDRRTLSPIDMEPRMIAPILKMGTMHALRKGFPGWDITTKIKLSINLEALYKR